MINIWGYYLNITVPYLLVPNPGDHKSFETNQSPDPGIFTRGIYMVYISENSYYSDFSSS